MKYIFILKIYKICHTSGMKMQIGNNSHYSLQYEHIMKLSGRFRTNRRKYFFNQPIIKLWNLLLQDVMEAESINELKM